MQTGDPQWQRQGLAELAGNAGRTRAGVAERHWALALRRLNLWQPSASFQWASSPETEHWREWKKCTLLFLYGEYSTSSFIYYCVQYMLTMCIASVCIFSLLLNFPCVGSIKFILSYIIVWWWSRVVWGEGKLLKYTPIQTSSLTLLFFLDTGSEWSQSLESAWSPTYGEVIKGIISTSISRC